MNKAIIVTCATRVWAPAGFALLWLACVLAAAHPAQAQTRPWTETALHAFAASAPQGAVPFGGVIRDAAGNLYGATYNGGALGFGTVFKVNCQGIQTVLHSFTNGADGGFPSGNLIVDSAGNLYGTAQSGGTANAGVVYKVNPNGQETVLYSFTGGDDGGFPDSSVILDPAGDLYGTTNRGGTGGVGVVFELEPSGNLTVLHTFTGGADGAYPNAGVVRDPAGNLYGTTYSGGSEDAGVVYKVNLSGQETVLYTFRGRADGAYPYGELVGDESGNFYGTTAGGGDLGCDGGCGVVYKLDRTGHETVLYTFTGGTGGASPYAGVMRDQAGNLYGTTSSGGDLSACAGSGCGVVYKLDPSGYETVLYNFMGGADGADPMADVIRDSEGNLYGTTSGGGPASFGVVYKLDPSGRETWRYAFPSPPNGSQPSTGVIRDPAGNLYGTTNFGGAVGAGVVFKLDPAGRETVLHSFTGGADGGSPYAGVIRDSSGNLYGTTEFGGMAGQGVVFELSPAGSETVLYSFTGGADGDSPSGGVIRDSSGNLYGTTETGGTTGAGVVFMLSPAGVETVLYSFTGEADGGYPNGPLLRDSSGNLYGTAKVGGTAGQGVVFMVSAAGSETALYSFTGGADGGSPQAGLISDPDGGLYGTTLFGGAAGSGVVFELSPANVETVLYSFTGGADGGLPFGGVARDPAGNLYGTTFGGGTAGVGVVFKLDPAGSETVLYTFLGGAEGGGPSGSLILDPSGNLFGTAGSGGKGEGGVVFELQHP